MKTGNCEAPWTISGKWRYIDVYLFIYLFIYVCMYVCILKVKRKGVCTTFVNAVILCINLRRYAVIAGPAHGSVSSSSSVLLQN